ncbi:hypothetical protein A2V82_02665, partial [candidate division KSB1 bacterium RBG_16_48_16]
MKNWLKWTLFSLWLCCVLSSLIYAQGMDQLHGDEAYAYRGIYEGNQIRVPFYNDGFIGNRPDVNPDDFKGNWPIGTTFGYINQLAPFIGAEVLDVNGVVRHIVSEPNGMRPGNLGDAASGDTDELGRWRTLAPLPGFANDEIQEIAMSHKRGTWPVLWPDQMDQDDPGWQGSWNGYFGRNQFNADQESYFVLDDYLNNEFLFYPDAADSSRRGLGLRGYVRGMQWNNILVEDVLFSLYDIENAGTYNHDKINFGMLSGPDIGSPVAANVWGDSDDDGGEYDLDLDLGWHTDQDWIGFDGSQIGYHGLAFFETPGSPYDGIDNDGDGMNSSGPIISEAMFSPVTYNAGDNVVVIDYQTFSRTVVTMPAQGVDILYLGKKYTFLPGVALEEIPNNLIDDNLNGIIDENNGSELRDENGQFIRSVWLYVGSKYIDYFTGDGLNNPLIDERRDDGIDNDGDWDPQKDDTGADGVEFSGDRGEGDGLPTDGEKHVDATDISESDMIGLTAFNIFTPWTLYPLYGDEELWEGIMPGFLNARGQYGNTDILMGSGYFPLPAGEINRFSLGVLFGDDKDDLVRNKQWANEAYDNNYEFAKAPAVPTVTARAGNNRVTLYWDDLAEKVADPVLGLDFEGYRIYRSTSDDWSDMRAITDVWGSNTFRKPIAQFDLDNGVEGKFPLDVKGVYFDLGTDNGIVHTWTDSTAKNGFRYFYAVTSYDHGDLPSGLPPTECSYILSIRPDGTISTGTNVVQVRPEAPSAGFVGPAYQGQWLENSSTSGQVQVEMVDQFAAVDGDYNITFEDEYVERSQGVYPSTLNFSVVNGSDPLNPDTLMNRQPIPGEGEVLPSFNGFRIHLTNVPNNTVSINTDSSQWNREGILPFNLNPFRSGTMRGLAKASDYRIEFYENAGADTSVFFDDGRTGYTPMPVNVRIFNLTENKQIDFAIRDRDGEAGIFSAFTGEAGRYSDELYFLENNAADSLVVTWRFSLGRSTDTTVTAPRAEDYCKIVTHKPFLKHDVFQFSTTAAHLDKEKANGDLDDIRVVPNPYIVANAWEPENTFENGRGPRELHFINLPPKCTIRIYNVRGQLIATMEHNDTIWNGTEI